MKCFRHTSEWAVGSCRACGRGLCAACSGGDVPWLHCGGPCAAEVGAARSEALQMAEVEKVRGPVTMGVGAFLFLVGAVLSLWGGSIWSDGEDLLAWLAIPVGLLLLAFGALLLVVARRLAVAGRK